MISILADEEGNVVITKKNELVDRNCECCSRTSLFVCWLKIQNYINIFVSDPLFDLFITLCIVFNTLFMMLEHHGQPEELTQTLIVSNYVSQNFRALEFLYICSCTVNFKGMRVGERVWDSK